MEEFEKAVEFLNPLLSEEDWKFLSLVICSMIWSAECHEHLIEAAGIYKRDIKRLNQTQEVLL
jgi:hypothetical protein